MHKSEHDEKNTILHKKRQFCKLDNSHGWSVIFKLFEERSAPHKENQTLNKYYILNIKTYYFLAEAPNN